MHRRAIRAAQGLEFEAGRHFVHVRFKSDGIVYERAVPRGVWDLVVQEMADADAGVSQIKGRKPEGFDGVKI